MKILPQHVAAFLKQPPPAITACLIYGPDNGLVKEHFTTLSKNITPALDDPFTVTDFTYETLKDNPFLLSDALAELSFFGGRKLIRIHNAPASISPALQEIITSHTEGAFLIISSGDLPPTSNLRKLFETPAYLATIPCYNDEGVGLRKLIESRLTLSGVSFDPDVIPYLLRALAGDRLIISSELEKLVTYMGDSSHITLEDASSCIASDPLESSLEALSFSLASRDAAAIQQNLTLLLSEAISPIAMLRTASNYFMRLYSVKTLLTQGTAESQAMSQLRPPVFFKNVPLFQQHLRNWTEAGLLSVIRTLVRLEAECKKTGSPAELLCSQFFTLIGARKSL
jgi:DNA polymerase III subunit delta